MNLQQMFRSYKRYIYTLLAVYVVSYQFTSQKIVFASLFLGTACGLLSIFTLVRRTEQIGRAIQEGGKVRSFGMFQRMAIAVIATAITLEFPNIFSIIPMILGLMTIYIVIIIDFLFKNYIGMRK